MLLPSSWFISSSCIYNHLFSGLLKKMRRTSKLLIKLVLCSVVVETISETSHLCWNNETMRFKSSLTSIIIESTYMTLNMSKIWGCFKVQVGWKNAFYGETGSRKGLGETLTIKKNIFNLHFKCQQNNNLSVFNVQIIRLYSLGSWNFYVPDKVTISKFKQVLRSRKGLDYNTGPVGYHKMQVNFDPCICEQLNWSPVNDKDRLLAYHSGGFYWIH